MDIRTLTGLYCLLRKFGEPTEEFQQVLDYVELQIFTPDEVADMLTQGDTDEKMLKIITSHLEALR